MYDGGYVVDYSQKDYIVIAKEDDSNQTAWEGRANHWG